MIGNIIDTHCKDFKKVLIVEDSKFLANNIHHKLINDMNLECDVAYTEKEAMSLLENNDYDLVVIDI